MKAKIDRLINLVIQLRDQAHDDELSDELDDAVTALEAASDRWTAISEDEDEDGDELLEDDDIDEE